MKILFLIVFFLVHTKCLSGQTEPDIGFVADYTKTNVSFVNLNVRLRYSSKLKSIIKKANEQGKPVTITYNLKTNSLVACKIVPVNNKASTELAYLSRPLSTTNGTQTSTIDTILTQKPLKHSISKPELKVLFTFLNNLSCQNSENCKNGSMPCITFQYKANGCQARAHLMRYYIEDSFHFESKKIFLFGSLHASNSNGCGGSCINWGWHVAPLVNEIDSLGTVVEKVIDPSLFNEPVTIEEWKKAQLNCSIYSEVDTMYIMDSKFYSWNYEGRGRNKVRYFYEDINDYGYHSYTLDFLRPKM